MADIFSNIRVNAGGVERSVNWYAQQIKKLGTLSSRKLLQNTDQLTTTIVPGKMYMFLYDPKYKETLPYYDRFPLVLPFRKTGDSFYGINLHYLPYAMRFKLLGFLADYVTDESVSESTRVNITWRMLESSSKINIVKPCVKQYLYNHMESKFLTIPYSDWVTASQLPVEQFVGADKNTVWRNSRKQF